jgi:hypothetical protein
VRKCPAIESSEYLCDRLAEYEVSGSVYCGTHARRVVEKSMKVAAVLDVLTEAAVDFHALPADLWRAVRGQAERNGDH